MKQRNTVQQLTLAAAVAAVYALLTVTESMFGVTFGPIQCRVAEALCILPFFFPETKWGLFVGCIIANLLSPYGLPDLIFGSLASLLAAFGSAKAPRAWMATLPPIVCNAVIVGALLSWYSAGGLNAKFPAAFALNAATVGIGEALSCCILGGILLHTIPRISFFRSQIPTDKLPKTRRSVAQQ